MSGGRRFPTLPGLLCASAVTGEESRPQPDPGALKNAAELMKHSKLIEQGREP